MPEPAAQPPQNAAASNPSPKLLPFDPAALRRQLAVDAAMRWGILLLVLLALVGGELLPQVNTLIWNLLIVAALVLWVFASTATARVAQQLPAINALAEQDPVGAEAQIAQALRRRPLQRMVRLLLYRQFAAIRHQQQRFDESAAICQSVLWEMGPAGRGANRIIRISPFGAVTGEQVRVRLLLLLVEARLHSRDLPGAYVGIIELHRCRLSLVERLQLLALQTQYEVAAGYHDRALDRVRQKIVWCELMPSPQCGAFHGLLAVAAMRSRRTRLAAWLRRRAELLCTPQQLELFQRAIADPNQSPDPIPPATPPVG